MQERKLHRKNETKQWRVIQQQELKKLRKVSQYLLFNVAAYLVISLIEFYLAKIGHSQTLRADALNNLSGIVSAVLLLTGNFIARDINDDDVMGQPLPDDLQNNGQKLQLIRFHYETIYTMITGLVMMAISINVVYSGFKGLFQEDIKAIPQPITLVGAGIAMLIMLLVWWFNKTSGLKLQNAALVAASKDSFSDALTSLGTMIAIGGALLFRVTWLDGVSSIIVGLFILFAGVKIFRDSSLNLADYFDPQAEAQFKMAIEKIPQVNGVEEINAHYSGNIVTLDVTISVEAHMEVQDSFWLCEKIEAQMRHQFGIVDTDVIVVPA